MTLLSRPYFDSIAGIDTRRGARVVRKSNGDWFDLSHEVASILERRGVLSRYSYLQREADRSRRIEEERDRTARINRESATEESDVLTEILRQLFPGEPSG